MNTPNGTYKEWVSKSNVVRDSGSPQDLVTVIRPATAVTGTVEVPFAKGSRVAYSLIREATVVVNGVTGMHEITFDEATDAIVGIQIVGTEQQKQTSFMSL
jgi:hypothetical protein